MRSLRQRLRERVEAHDLWDEGGGFILARDVGGDVTSYTGTKGWNAGAGHEPPPIEPALQQVKMEIDSAFERVQDLPAAAAAKGRLVSVYPLRNVSFIRGPLHVCRDC